MASPLFRDALFACMYALDKQNFKEARHRLEQESGIFFNMEYLDEMVTNGRWDEAEKYVSGYTKLEDNPHSMEIFFEITKQKYLEELDRYGGATEIPVKDFKIFSAFNEVMQKEIKRLFTLGNFGDYYAFGHTKSTRSAALYKLKQLIQGNPVFHDKLIFPNIQSIPLCTLFKQWLSQQQRNSSHEPFPVINNPLSDVVSKRPRSPLNISTVDDSLHLPKKTKVNQGLDATSIDFHPTRETLLLVGTKSGEFMLWDLDSRKQLAQNNFKVWDIGACSTPLQTTLANDYNASVNRITWSPNGALFGVAYSKSIVQIYSYDGGDKIKNQLEIEAHSGSVHDLAFSYHNKTLSIVTFGDDRWIKVWDAGTGDPQMKFDAEGGLIDRTGDEATENSRQWKVKEISEASHCRCLRLPDSSSSAKRVRRLTYTNSGVAVLALAVDGVHKLWKWQETATTSGLPQMLQPTGGIVMANDIRDTSTKDSPACFALSKNDAFIFSASGGMISYFGIGKSKIDIVATRMPPPPAATFLVLYPRDNNILAIGMDDASILIYNYQTQELKMKLMGHHKSVTGLAFANACDALVSSGADSQLCLWSTDSWEKQRCRQLHTPGGCDAAPFADTQVQFHQDQKHLLVVHETQIAVFKYPLLKCLKQWCPEKEGGAITHVCYSCDSQILYVTLVDGSIVILVASTLRLRCRISSTSYLPSNLELRVYPVVVAAHPSERNQFAFGLTDGGVCVMEPHHT